MEERDEAWPTYVRVFPVHQQYVYITVAAACTASQVEKMFPFFFKKRNVAVTQKEIMGLRMEKVIMALMGVHTKGKEVDRGIRLE